MLCLSCIQWAKFLVKIHVAPLMSKRLVPVQRQKKAAVEMPEATIQARNFIYDPNRVPQGGIYPPAGKIPSLSCSPRLSLQLEERAVCRLVH